MSTGPYREVVGSKNVQGFLMEVLSCGHVARNLSFAKRAKRRRCGMCQESGRATPVPPESRNE